MREWRGRGEFRHVCNNNRTESTAKMTLEESVGEFYGFWIKPSCGDASTTLLLMGTVFFLHAQRKRSTLLK